MNSKNKFAFLSVALAALLALGACTTPTKKSSSEAASSTTDTTSIGGTSENNSQPSSVAPSSNPSSSSNNDTSSPSSSSSSSSSEQPATKYTVTFVVNGTTVQTIEVQEGEVAIYNGATPTKEDGSGTKYRFKGWSPDINTPITQNTTFTAEFSAYSDEQMIDDFETYEDSPSMKDEGWMALGYSNSTQTWTPETAATVSLGYKSEEGQQSLRFGAWENGVGYKFAKTFKDGEFKASANALQFRLMVPQINTVKVLLHAKMTIAGSVQSPSFTYTLNVPSSDFVEYTIPLSDDGWALWGEAGKSINWAADWLGVHEDDLLNYLTKIEFYIQGNDGATGAPYVAFLDSARFVTLDNPTNKQEENLAFASRYTATLSDGSTLRLDIGANGAATASVIDLETPVSVTGTITLSGRDVTFTSSALNYSGTLTNHGNLIKFKSASGSLKSLVEDIDLVGVQVVDNFEQYTSDGKSYYQSSTIDQRSGCRGAYYSEYYAGSGSSPWGGNGWQLMGGDGSQLKLKQDSNGAHSGNNYLCIKHSKDKAMRYMQWGLFDGTAEKNAFRGSKFGFWAKSNGWVQSFKFYMYSQTSPTNATKDQYVKSYQFTETEAINEWKHYEIELNPKVVYYGFMILVEKNYSLSANEAYLYVDDIEVYGANPYAAYEAPEPEKPFALTPGLSYNAKVYGLAQAFLDIKKDNAVSFRAPGIDVTGEGTYEINDKEITFTFEPSVAPTIYVATASDDGLSLTFKSVNDNGTRLSQVLNNLSFNMLPYGDTAESYESAGTMYYQGNTNEKEISGARGAYYCDYYTGSGTSPIGGSGWNLMGGSGDQLTLDTENFHEGKQSLKMKKSTAGGMRYIQWDLYKGTAREYKGMTKFSVWLKNQATAETKLKIYVFTAQQITSANQTTARIDKEVTLAASQDWTEYVIELDANTSYYGYGIFLNAASATGWINVDNAMFYGPDNDVSLNYFAEQNLLLEGNIPAGGANIRFGGNTTAYFTCENLGAYNIPATVTTRMNGNNQEMVFTFNESVITGKYVVTYGGVATFTVTSVTGVYEPYVPVDTFFLTNN